MTNTPQPQQTGNLKTRKSASIRTLPKALPFKLPILNDEQSSKLAVDMSDLLLLAWTLLARRHRDKDDIHFAWGYGKVGEKTLSHRKAAVGRGNIVSEVLQQIQILRRQALIPDEVSEDQDGNYMIINNSFGTLKSSSPWTFQIEVHEIDETIWLNPSWDANFMGQDTAISNVHCFMDILNSVLSAQG